MAFSHNFTSSRLYDIKSPPFAGIFYFLRVGVKLKDYCKTLRSPPPPDITNNMLDPHWKPEVERGLAGVSPFS
jgi:hypothetical protein